MLLGQPKSAAEELGLTQASVSHAMRRLSNILGYQVFVRRRGVAIPTARAIEIAPEVSLIIATVIGITTSGSLQSRTEESIDV